MAHSSHRANATIAATEIAMTAALVAQRSILAVVFVIVNSQGEFDFERTGSNEGYTKWLTARRITLHELARRMNLPLGHQVEVWLCGGVRLRGQLRLQDEVLFIEEDRMRHLPMLVDRVPFTYRDMESCVKLD